MNFVFHLFIFFSAFWSGFAPADRFTWYLEVIPGFAGWVILMIIGRRIQLPILLQLIFFFHILLLFVGGHFTYSEVPGFTWNLPFLGGIRNHFDKLGHFFQGITPALISMEVIRRNSLVRTIGWARFFSICVALSCSAFYELVEWWVSVSTGEGGDAFLGTQGYVWDTQSDMLMALIGAGLAVAIYRIRDEDAVR